MHTGASGNVNSGLSDHRRHQAGDPAQLTDQALELLETCAISELLPPELAQGMMSLPGSLRTLHRPPPSLQLSELKAASTRHSSG